MNEVLYAFIGFDPATGDVKSLDAWADQNEMPTLSKAVYSIRICMQLFHLVVGLMPSVYSTYVCSVNFF